MRPVTILRRRNKQKNVKKEDIKDSLARDIQASLANSKLEKARNMLNEGLPMDIIAKITGLHAAKIETLRTQ